MPCLAQAQWYKNFGKKISFHTPSIHPQFFRVPSQQIERAARQAMVHNSLPTNIEKSILFIKERDFAFQTRIPASAFVIEETYKGKKYMWGVTASHYGFIKPAIQVGRFNYLPISFLAQGNRNANDVTIFPLPAQLKPHVKPLPLAAQSPNIGETLFSLSFFNKELYYEPGRKLLEKTSLRMVTSLKIDPEILREGACGAALLNQQGEVVGMHVGSSRSRSIGFVIPVEQIYLLLQEYHQPGSAQTSVLLHGRELFKLAINEGIIRVHARKNGQVIRTRFSYHHEKDLDYNHLENFIDLSEADEIGLSIERTNFSNKNQMQESYYLTFPLSTSSTPTQP